ncbi:MAG: Wzz/FepE/Etk N-terminal domain-containing protein [Chitinophagales bacterium]|nr:Wzz/FepE/Etk N-terminal domain-containing protein [Chitinophagales bacterium]
MENKLDLTGSGGSAPKGQQTNFAEGFNLGLLIYILNKSILWIILIVAITVFASFIYLRYTPRIYEATTKMILQLEKSTQILGIDNLVFEKDPTEINREMQVLKSTMLLGKIADKLPLDISYLKEGKSKFITEDLYQSAPFEILPEQIAPEFYGNPVYIRLVNKNSMVVSYSFNGDEFEKEIKPEQKLKTPYFQATISLKPDKLSDGSFNSLYFVKFNDKQTIINDINSKITIEPIEAGNNTLAITYADQNPEKAKDIANALATEFIDYDLNKKREGMGNILRFIDGQIDSFSREQQAIQDSVAQFKINNEIFSDDNSSQGILTSANALQQALIASENQLYLLQNFKMLLQKTKDYSTLPILQFKEEEMSIAGEIENINQLQRSREIRLLERTEDHPEVRLLDKQIFSSKNQLLKRTEYVIDNAELELGKQRERYQKLMSKIYSLPELQENLKRLNRIADAKNKFFYNLFDQRSNYSIAYAGIVPDYSVLAVAQLPKTPVSPKETQVKIGGFVLGLLLGILLVAIRYMLHQISFQLKRLKQKAKCHYWE